MTIEQQKLQAQMQIEQMKVQAMIDKANIDARTKRELKTIELNQAAEEEMDRQAMQQLSDSIAKGMEALAQAQQEAAQRHEESMMALAQTLTRPKQVIRGEDGKVVGIQ